MEGVEANARLSLSFADGLAGDVLLSRDWNLREQCYIQFENGWVFKFIMPNDPNHLDVGLTSDFILRSAIRSRLQPADGPSLSEPGATFQRAFINQILNVIHAVVAGEPLLVPGEEGARSIRVIEACYRSRRMLEMPWMSQKELSRARTFA
jgi:predicted dehydrogenase